jgi:hypothetical protein
MIIADEHQQWEQLAERVSGELREVWEEGVEEHLRELVAANKEDKHNTLRQCADYLNTHQHLSASGGSPSLPAISGNGLANGIGSSRGSLQASRKPAPQA